jgi:hypothetical protein
MIRELVLYVLMIALTAIGLVALAEWADPSPTVLLIDAKAPKAMPECAPPMPAKPFPRRPTIFEWEEKA